jgi:hypothetical protein
MENQSGKESVSEEITKLTIQMEDFNKRKNQCLKKVQELMAEENPGKGIFHHKEIFTLQQERLTLEVQAEFCRKKLNRLNLGYFE